MKKVYAKEEYCVACRNCEVACITAHSKSKDPIKAYKKEGMRYLSRTRVEEKGSVAISVQCRHCDEPECVEACMTGAMQKTESGAVIVDQEKCIGCWMCIMACSFGGIKRDLRAGKVSSKCDLCADREIPACVEICPNRALVYEER